MKIKNLLLPILAGGALTLPSWADSAAQLIQAQAQEAPATTAKKAPALTVVPDFDIAAMSKKLGFAAHAPKNTEFYFSLIEGYDMFQRLTQTELGKLTIELLEGTGKTLEEFEAEEEIAMLKAILGEEIFITLGDGFGQQGANLSEFGQASNFHQMKMMVKLAAATLGGEAEEEEMRNAGLEMFTNIMGDPKTGLPFFEKLELPPIILGVKISDPDAREKFSGMLQGAIISMLDPDAPLEEIDLQKDGIQLSGLSLIGKKLAAMADEDNRSNMDQMFGSEEGTTRFLKALESKNLHLATGVKGDHLFIYLGGSLDDLKFAAKPADSLLASSQLDFLKAYTEKEIRIFAFTANDAMQAAASGEVLSSMVKGLQAGLAETAVFGDTRDVQALLGHVATVEGSLMGMLNYRRAGMVGFLEEGFKIESHGGSNLPMIDTEKPHTFTSLGEMEDILYFSNSRTNPEFTSKAFDLLDSAGQAAYLMGERIAGLDIDEKEFRQFSESFKMFDQVAAADIKEIWQALTTDWAEGTDDEGALIIDTRGTLPKIPGIPSAIIEKGRIPRLAYVTPITDRAKLSTAWTRIEKSIGNMLKTVKKTTGFDIPMQEIDDNTKEGVTYFSTAIQFSTKDARPVIALTDDHFYLSTSQKLIAQLNAKLAEGNAPERKGAYARLDLEVAQALVHHSLTLLSDNADEIFTTDSEKEDFKENLPKIKKVLKALSQFQEITSHTRKEGQESRWSLHIKTK